MCVACRPDGQRPEPGGRERFDFTSDGLPDLSPRRWMSIGGLCLSTAATARSRIAPAAGLGDQIYALNVARAGFDNDGNPTSCCCAAAGKS